LDLTEDTSSPFDRSSTGLGAAGDEWSAVAVAVRELIERDAQGEWRRGALSDRLATIVDHDTIKFPWFAAWCARLARYGIRLSIHALPALADTPIFSCTLAGPAEFGDDIRVFAGSSAHWSPETALFRALAEAMQSRLTWIAGSRDDILPADYAPSQLQIDPGQLPLPPGVRPVDFAAIAPGPEHIADVSATLARQGFETIAVKRLAHHLRGIVVVKAFIPGLGTLHRRRRLPV
jgi:ribosomal protein S12 methylthiotransferase accessory factor